ncbi:MAG: bifunctional methionine sulfoxide reductase B/A protein [Candidatus Brocadiae bacterium]|nr:bifunctional methionine sulfoxide reductase B/A protein [Candidatus Brocadiia bacterium]
MKFLFTLLLCIFVFFFSTYCKENNMEQKPQKMQKEWNPLTPEEEHIIVHKGTERPFSGKYYNHKEKGLYVCRRCNAALYKSESKFDSGCGWPSFDDEIPKAVNRVPDADGRRTEILCANCNAHLGHVFLGEGFTAKNTRHCVNSISMSFIPLEKAYFAAGCFWGVEYYFAKAKGVMETTVGYMGGEKENPTYQEVCSHNTGHAEALEVVFNPALVSYKELARLFFEIHDFTQVDRQGPDIGDQYRTEIFYTSEEQKKTAEEIISLLSAKGYKVATKLTKASVFWKAEDYHQDYYEKKGSSPYCHARKKIFD